MEPGSHTVLATFRSVLVKVWELLCYIYLTPISVWMSTHSEYYSWRIEELIKQEKERSGMTDVEVKIEASKVHWTQTMKPKQGSAEQESCISQVVAKDNEQVFESHLKKPWCRFFMKMDNSTDISDTPIAAGGQAKIYLEKQVSGEPRSHMGRTRFVLKVHEHQRALQLLLEQGVPKGMLGSHVLTRQRLNEWVDTPDGGMELRTVYTTGRPSTQLRMHQCGVSHVVLLKDGRLAFRIAQYSSDLRKFIDHLKMQDNECPPFTDDVATLCMLQTAMGMRDLHKDDIVHSDLKASNVLISNSLHGLEHVEDLREYPLYCWVADFESSVGCMGTKFWNAPEILLYLHSFKELGNADEEEEVLEEAEVLEEEVVLEEAEVLEEEEVLEKEDGEEKDPVEDDLKFLKESDPNNKKLELFTKEADVYSYAMTCYEILTGFLPFEREEYYGQKVEDLDVFRPPFKRPRFPSDIKPWMKELLEKCWHHDPLERPTFEEIVTTIEEREPSSKERLLRLWAHSQ